MSEQESMIDFRARLNPDTGRIEISVLSEAEPKEVDAVLSSFLRFRGAVDGSVLEGLSVDSEKVDPASMPASARLRAMWEKTTCDIIK